MDWVLRNTVILGNSYNKLRSYMVIPGKMRLL